MSQFIKSSAQTVLSSCAVDATLLLGAESFVDIRRSFYSSDPDARKLLADLIDLVLNCRTLQMPIPAQIVETGTWLEAGGNTISNLPNATVSLSQSVDNSLRRRFTHLALREHSYLKYWVTFQTTGNGCKMFLM
jgi:hypothetical protein